MAEPQSYVAQHCNAEKEQKTDAEAFSDLVRVLSAVLTELVQRNDQLPTQQQVTRFHAMRAPAITIQKYLERIVKYSPCSQECFIVAMIYIDRVIRFNNLILNSLNVHRFLITSILLAAKYYDDCYYNNAYYAKVGGVPGAEMNALELEFLFLSNFNLEVPEDLFKHYSAELHNYVIPASFSDQQQAHLPQPQQQDQQQQPLQSCPAAAAAECKRHASSPDNLIDGHHSPDGVTALSNPDTQWIPAPSA